MSFEIKTLSNYELKDAIDRMEILYKGCNSATLQALYSAHSKILLAEQALRAQAREIEDNQGGKGV